MHGGRAIHCTGVVQYVARVHIIYRVITELLQKASQKGAERKLIIMIGGIWYRVPEKILQDTELTRSDIAVFAVIADRADGESCTMAAAELAALAGCCVRTVKTAVKRLSDRGYISIERAEGSANTYRQLVLPPKRRAGRSKKTNEGPDPEIEKYKCLINNFDDLKEAK